MLTILVVLPSFSLAFSTIETHSFSSFDFDFLCSLLLRSLMVFQAARLAFIVRKRCGNLLKVGTVPILLRK